MCPLVTLPLEGRTRTHYRMEFGSMSWEHFWGPLCVPRTVPGPREQILMGESPWHQLSAGEGACLWSWTEAASHSGSRTSHSTGKSDSVSLGPILAAKGTWEYLPRKRKKETQLGNPHMKRSTALCLKHSGDYNKFYLFHKCRKMSKQQMCLTIGAFNGQIFE